MSGMIELQKHENPNPELETYEKYRTPDECVIEPKDPIFKIQAPFSVKTKCFEPKNPHRTP